MATPKGDDAQAWRIILNIKCSLNRLHENNTCFSVVQCLFKRSPLKTFGSVEVRRLYGMSTTHEEGAVYLGRVRLRRQRPGDVPLRPIRATSQRLRHEGLRYASAILALSTHVSDFFRRIIRDNLLA